MGARAQYVVVENGRWQRYWSHWGAQRVVADLLPGPAASTRCFRANREAEEWLDDVWCEGAALVDHDRKVLLWFMFLDTWAEHRAARALLARTWPGWDVRFAHDAVGDLTHHLGLGRDLTRTQDQFEPSEPLWSSETDETDPWTVLSLRLPDGSVRAWGGCREPMEHLADGPRLAGLLASSSATPVATDMPYAGIHYDPQARTVSLWAVQTVPGIHRRPLPGWDGWTLDFRGDDHTWQAELLPADYPFPRSPLADALRRLGNGLATPPPDPAALLALAARTPGPEGTVAVVNAAALVPHDPARPTPAELAALHAAIADLAAGAGTD
ncbi:hypothetical protein ACIA8O_37120 [Kitasatospora sp. NPDC051853]|uniref:hypothetical protein n=1 Tax=Kitasatospora sp. NPDC051853 TaxID=3364058 RepID=UPI003795A0B9